VSKIRVVIADDHAVVRTALRALLEAQPDIAVVGEAEDGLVVERLCGTLAPDIALLDLSMPGRSGVAVATDIVRSSPRTRVVVLTMHEEPAYVRLAAASGARGYVSKRALATELVDAIRAVHRGERYTMPEFAAAFEAGTPAPRERGSEARPELLTEREREVTRLIALGYTNAEIASELHIGQKTVETHRAHVLGKLGLRTRADLVRFALEFKLIDV
jgi:two-component system, NarL family, response regulator NreC